MGLRHLASHCFTGGTHCSYVAPMLVSGVSIASGWRVLFSSPLPSLCPGKAQPTLLASGKGASSLFSFLLARGAVQGLDRKEEAK